jgi:nucleoside-diphosphate-sugar epimerase
MKYLVTGGAGFIGSHLVERLLSEGHKVVVVDDFSMGKWENIPVNDPNLVIYPTTIMGEIAGLYRGVDKVFHLAALTRPQVSILNPEDSTRVNVLGTLNVIQCCLKNDVKKLVFVSSSSLYGEQDQYPTPENATPHPMSPYALTKLVGEQYCKLYEVLNGLKANYIRPFNVYGSRQSPEGGYAAAVPKFIEALTSDQPGNITGDGEQRRDFTYVDDVVDLIIKASEVEVYGEAFNAGAGNNHSINELYKTISNVLGKDIPPKYIAPVVEPHMTLADTSKGLRMLGWKPKVSLEEGIRRML